MKIVNTIFGIILIIISISAYFPSMVPGAMSIIGYLIGITVVLLSLITTRITMFFFWLTSLIFLIGMIFFNDLIRLVNDPVEMPVTYKIGVYLITFVVLVCLYFVSRWLNKANNIN